MSTLAAEVTMIDIVATTDIVITGTMIAGIGIASITAGGIGIGITIRVMIVTTAAAIDGTTIDSATKVQPGYAVAAVVLTFEL